MMKTFTSKGQTNLPTKLKHGTLVPKLTKPSNSIIQDEKERKRATTSASLNQSMSIQWKT